jgi:hypothetical protein
MSEHLPSRRKVLAKLGTSGAALLGVGLLANAGDAGAADGATVLRPGAKPLPPGIKSVQGSWVGTLELPDGTKRLGMATFTPNGGMTTTGQGDILNASPQGSGHGAWVQDGSRVDHHIFKFVGDASGALVGIYEEVASSVLDASGDGMITDAWFNVRAVDGTIIREGTVTIRATRVTMNSPSPLDL